MNWLLENLGIITTVATAVYPASLFLLPANTASKISVGVKVVKGIANALENAQNTKGGLTTQKELTKNIKYQKSRS